MLLIHRIVDQGLMEGAGSTEHLLLRSGSAQETSTRKEAISEIQGKRAQSDRDQASRRSKGRLIRNLDPRFPEGGAIGTWQRSIRANAPLGSTSRFHGISPDDLLTALRDIPTVTSSMHRRLPERSRNISRNLELLPSGSGHLRGIEAR
jgi:hypothetical protein